MKSGNLTELANQFKSDKGTKHFDKHGYTVVYETLFSSLRSAPIAFLELGLCIGGPEFGDRLLDRVPTDMPSIRMWREYFKKARIYGFDINDFTHLESELEDFTFLRGNLSSKNDIEILIKVTARLESKQDSVVYDAIVDDASHASFHQQQAFSLLFPCLKPQGLYVIEDLNWQSLNYEDRLPSVPKTLALLKQLKELRTLPEDYLFREEMVSLANRIQAIDFYCDDKLAVIQKV